MNSQFNYATFVDLFLKCDEQQEPCGIGQPAPPAARDDAAEIALSPLA